MYKSIYMFNILVEFTFAHIMFNTIHSPKTKATTAPLGMQGIQQTRWADGEWRPPPGIKPPWAPWAQAMAVFKGLICVFICIK